MWPRLVHKKRNDECSMKIKTYLYCKKKGRKRRREREKERKIGYGVNVKGIVINFFLKKRGELLNF